MKIYRGFLEINNELICYCKSNNYKYIDKKMKLICKKLRCNGIICSLGGFKWYGE